jgi:hypothetical protein
VYGPIIKSMRVDFLDIFVSKQLKLPLLFRCLPYSTKYNFNILIKKKQLLYAKYAEINMVLGPYTVKLIQRSD